MPDIDDTDTAIDTVFQLFDRLPEIWHPEQLSWEIYQLLGRRHSLIAATVEVLQEVAHALAAGDPPAGDSVLDRIEEIVGHLRSAASLGAALQPEVTRLARAISPDLSSHPAHPANPAPPKPEAPPAPPRPGR
ncbi:hypothetical protein EBN88_00515 [Streptomyces triticirhizae]|uniref:Uncharacterized protein n=1 Tax=Streptomyces triticirhizae TaxID=2483353 RepID=A0A3M2MHJ4_9ACTN|nr:hypothetical protein EBN88_00515 [Streptomyces triticirhizae]